MNTTAYLLIGVDIHTHKVVSADVFSEDNPTINLSRIRTFEVSSFTDSTFIKAVNGLRRRIYNDEFYAWVRPLIGPRTLNAFSQAQLECLKGTVPVKDGDV